MAEDGELADEEMAANSSRTESDVLREEVQEDGEEFLAKRVINGAEEGGAAKSYGSAELASTDDVASAEGGLASLREGYCAMYPLPQLGLLALTACAVMLAMGKRQLAVSYVMNPSIDLNFTNINNPTGLLRVLHVDEDDEVSYAFWGSVGALWKSDARVGAAMLAFTSGLLPFICVSILGAGMLASSRTSGLATPALLSKNFELLTPLAALASANLWAVAVMGAMSWFQFSDKQTNIEDSTVLPITDIVITFDTRVATGAWELGNAVVLTQLVLLAIVKCAQAESVSTEMAHLRRLSAAPSWALRERVRSALFACVAAMGLLCSTIALFCGLTAFPLLNAHFRMSINTVEIAESIFHNLTTHEKELLEDIEDDVHYFSDNGDFGITVWTLLERLRFGHNGLGRGEGDAGLAPLAVMLAVYAPLLRLACVAFLWFCRMRPLVGTAVRTLAQACSAVAAPLVLVLALPAICGSAPLLVEQLLPGSMRPYLHLAMGLEWGWTFALACFAFDHWLAGTFIRWHEREELAIVEWLAAEEKSGSPAPPASSPEPQDSETPLIAR